MCTVPSPTPLGSLCCVIRSLRQLDMQNQRNICNQCKLRDHRKALYLSEVGPDLSTNEAEWHLDLMQRFEDCNSQVAEDNRVDVEAYLAKPIHRRTHRVPIPP